MKKRDSVLTNAVIVALVAVFNMTLKRRPVLSCPARDS